MNEPVKAVDFKALESLITAILFASDGPTQASLIVDLINSAFDEEEWAFPVTIQQVKSSLNRLRGHFSEGGALELIEAGGGWRLRTAPNLASMIRRLWPERRVRLSKAALEALSVIAYRQPCTRLDVEAVRGVDCGGVIRSLLERQLVRITGKKDEPGRPLLYGTTPLFLETFSLENLDGLPTLRDLEQLEAEERARQQIQVALDLKGIPQRVEDMESNSSGAREGTSSDQDISDDLKNPPSDSIGTSQSAPQTTADAEDDGSTLKIDPDNETS